MPNPFDNNNPNQISMILDSLKEKPRIIQLTQCVNEETLIEPCLKQVADKVDQVICIHGAVQSKVNAGQATPDGKSLDRTGEILERLQEDPLLKDKLLVIEIGRPWQNLEELKNAFLSYLRPGDYILILDADEFIHPDTVDKLRETIDTQPLVNEIVPVFYHFWKDKYHIKSPNDFANFGVQHQRFVKFEPGMHYRNHPVLTNIAGHCTYFSQHKWPFRFTCDWFGIYHYSYMNFKREELLAKKKFYDVELGQAKHGFVGAAERDYTMNEFLNYTEKEDSLLIFDKDHPSIIQTEPWFGQLDEKLTPKSFKHFSQEKPYSYTPKEMPLIYNTMIKIQQMPLFINPLDD